MKPQHDQANYGKCDRDSLADNARDGSKLYTKESVGFEMDFSPTTLEEEIDDGGWNRLQQPVPAEPQAESTSGGRGEPGRDYDTAHRDGRAYPW